MPIPPDYFHANQQFERFMLDARDAADLPTTNMAWNMVVGVLNAFRCRLTIRDALRFANILPPGIRALFVADWDAEQPLRKFTDQENLIDEIRSVRRVHNFSPETAHQAVAIALRKNLDEHKLDEFLKQISVQAYQFWFVDADTMKKSLCKRPLLIQCRDE